jgi:ATP-dependent Lon protease
MLDEVDKLGRDFRGDPASALLEVLDPEQNSTFRDNYLDVPFDLSRVLFITTANVLDPVPDALRDRMEIIPLEGYTEQEKVIIAFRYLIPRQTVENGLDSETDIQFHDSAVRFIVRRYTREAGVRNLEREIGRICRKVARLKAEEKRHPTVIAAESIEKFLGPQQFFQTEAERQDEVGVATSLAWTESGGEIMSIEVAVLDGKGNLQMTGQIGDVMQESGQAALTYVKSRAIQLGIDL